VTQPPVLADRLRGLEEKGVWLKRLGRRSIFLGFCLLSLAIFFWWPDPAGPEVLGPYVSVPAPLDALLIARGAAIQPVPLALVVNGPPPGLVLLLPIFLAGHVLIQRFLRSPIAKGLAYLLTPLWLFYPNAMIYEALGSGGHFSGANEGILVDREGAPPAKADGTSRPPVPAFHVRPEALPAVPADQARYVLAQQAYLDGDWGRAAGHLRGMRGAWRPAGGYERERIAILNQWTEAHGQDPGATARGLAGWGPFPTLYRIASLLAVLAAGICMLGGFGLMATGDWRRDRFGKLSKRSASAEAPEPDQLAAPAQAPAAPTFGRRRAFAAKA
jgi:hypothetical protein